MTQHAKTPSGFRNDINGLRAWAVVAVILYHFGVPGIGGGFVGVDVFFVISGFLMTGIVVGGLAREGGFSVWSFYMARARRILPALLVLCLVLLTLGWWLLLPLDYKMLGKHALAALTFLSNITFQREAGYFDAASHEKWLLHTWSLAVEWQFYMLLPLDVVKVRVVLRVQIEQTSQIYPGLRKGFLAVEELDDLGQPLGGEHLDVFNDGRLRAVRFRQDNAFEPLSFCRHGDREAAAYGLDLSV